MNKANFKSEIVFHSITEGRVTGVFQISSTETIRVDNILGYVLIEIRGQLSSVKKQISSFRVGGQTTLIKNVISEFPFSFVINNTDLYSYSGKNVDITYKCEIKMNVNQNDLGLLDRSVFKRIKSHITSDFSVSGTQYFEYKNKSNRYDVVSIKSDFNFTKDKIVMLMILVSVAALYYFLFRSLNIIYGVSVILTFLSLNYLSQNYIKKKLGNVNMILMNEEDGFKCIIGSLDKTKLKDVIIGYKILERVVDDRGTSPSICLETIYTSKIQELNEVKDNYKLEFKYPSRSGLHTLNYKDIDIYWEMIIKGKSSWGFERRLTCEFKVV